MASLATGNWNLNGNGFQGSLALTAVAANGALTGTAYGNKILGFWDEASRRISFMRLTTPSDPSTFQVYHGYLMTDDATLAGTFEAFQGSGATAEKCVFGWLAQLPKVIK